MTGRLADEVVLSAEECAFFEAQVRRYKAARSLSDRCRMILFCAEDQIQATELEELAVMAKTADIASLGDDGQRIDRPDAGDFA